MISYSPEELTGRPNTWTSHNVRYFSLPGMVTVTYRPCIPLQSNERVSPRPMESIVAHLEMNQINSNYYYPLTTTTWITGEKRIKNSKCHHNSEKNKNVIIISFSLSYLLNNESLFEQNNTSKLFTLVLAIAVL